MNWSQMASLTRREAYCECVMAESRTLQSTASVWSGVIHSPQLIGPHGVVQLIRRVDLGLEDGPQDADGRAHPEVGPVEHRQVAGEGDAAAARLDVVGPDGLQLAGQDVLDAPATGREILVTTHRLPLFQTRSPLLRGPWFIVEFRAGDSREKPRLERNQGPGVKGGVPGVGPNPHGAPARLVPCLLAAKSIG